MLMRRYHQGQYNLYERGRRHIKSKKKGKGQEKPLRIIVHLGTDLNAIQSGYTLNNTGASWLIKQS